MKKFLFLAMAAAAMVSCSQNEEIENAAQKAEIKLGTVVSNTTRAAVTDNESLKGEGFTVYAYKTGTTTSDKLTAGDLGEAYMNGAKATFAENWSLSDGPYYWPMSGNIQFFAYSTYATNAAKYELKADAIYPTLTYAIAATADAQKDLVVAKVVDKTYQTTALQLDFTHALTQINFTVTGGDKDLSYELSSIEIEGVYGSGTYSFGDGNWTVTGDADATYSYPISADNSAVSITGNASKVLDEGNANAALMLMPQKMTESALIKVTYKVLQNNTVINEPTSSISLNGKTAWGTGSKLRYTLELSEVGASIALVPEVGNWNAEAPAN